MNHKQYLNSLDLHAAWERGKPKAINGSIATLDPSGEFIVYFVDYPENKITEVYLLKVVPPIARAIPAWYLAKTTI